MNPLVRNHHDPETIEVEIQEVEAAEVDEMWSFVGKKEHQRWLWYAIVHQTGTVLASVLGTHEDKVFGHLQKLLNSFEISLFYTEDWDSSSRHLEPE